MQRNAHIGNLLGHEVADLQSWLDSFEPSATGRRRRATLGHTQEYVVVKSLPLLSAIDMVSLAFARSRLPHRLLCFE